MYFVQKQIYRDLVIVQKSYGRHEESQKTQQILTEFGGYHSDEEEEDDDSQNTPENESESDVDLQVLCF